VQESNIEQVPAQDREKWVADNAAIQLDVREPKEWATGTIEGATRISMGSIPARLAELDQETTVLVVCRSGQRSQRVAQYLVANGFEAANLAGGMIAVAKQTSR
jgi:rhodanese-related sulfurtransferase